MKNLEDIGRFQSKEFHVLAIVITIAITIAIAIAFAISCLGGF